MLVYHSGQCVNVDLKTFECGREECAPCHSWGPGIRSCCLVHYVERGTGILRINEKTYTLKAGQIFFVPPRVITYYEADKENPWTYRWVGIDGRNVEKFFDNGGINAQNPVMDASEELPYVMEQIIDCAENNDRLGFTALLYSFMSSVGAGVNNVSVNTNAENYIKKACEYIHSRLHTKLTVQEVSTYLNIDRSYLTFLFRRELSLSPQQYILAEKMKTACEYLSTTDYDVSHIAQSVGYEDLFAFSHAFKRVVGTSPSLYRKNMRE